MVDNSGSNAIGLQGFAMLADFGARGVATLFDEHGPAIKTDGLFEWKMGPEGIEPSPPD